MFNRRIGLISSIGLAIAAGFAFAPNIVKLGQQGEVMNLPGNTSSNQLPATPGASQAARRRRVRQFSSAKGPYLAVLRKKNAASRPKKKTALTKCAKRARAKAKYRNRK